MIAGVETAHLYATPHAAHLGLCPATHPGAHVAAVQVVKPVAVYQYQPAHVLVLAEHVVGYAEFHQLPPHTLIGPQVVKVAQADLVGNRAGMLTVIVTAVAATHVTRYIIMYARSIVVAISPARVVIRIAVVYACTHHVHTVYLPGKALAKSLVACQAVKGLALGQLPVVGRTPHHYVKEHAVGIWIAAEHADGLSNSIRGIPVVGIQEADVAARGQTERLVTRIGLPMVGHKRQTFYAGIGLGIALRYLQGVVGRTVVDHDYLYIGQRLTRQRVQTLAQVLLGVVGRHQHRAYRRRSAHT